MLRRIQSGPALTSLICTLALSTVFHLEMVAQRSLEDLGNEILAVITTANKSPDSLYISIAEYHKLIADQPLSEAEISNFQQEVNSFHPTQREAFSNGILQLQDIYVDVASRGAEITLDTIIQSPIEGTRNIVDIHLRIHIVYEGDDKPTFLILESMAGMVDRRLSLISPLQDSYE